MARMGGAMMRAAIRTANRWWVFSPAVAIYVGLWALPANFWFESRSLKVADAYAGEAPIVVEDRAVRWSFHGSYSVATRYAEVPQEIVGGCAGDGKVAYRGGLDGVKSYDLVEFTDGKEACRHLPPGTYFTEVCRTVERPLWGILPAKTTCRTSNVFKIEAKP